MSRPHTAFQPVAKAFDVDGSAKSRRIHLLDGGANKNPRPLAASNPASFSKDRADTSRKSSFGPNCLGFTKIETTTGLASRRAASTSERWPACNAPMVGTKPDQAAFGARLPRAPASSIRRCRMISTRKRPGFSGNSSGLRRRARDKNAIRSVPMGLAPSCRSKRGHLAAMVRAVIRNVLQRSATDRVFVHADFHGFDIRACGSDRRPRARQRNASRSRSTSRPARAQAGQVRELDRRRQPRPASGRESAPAKSTPRRKCAPACRAPSESSIPGLA